VGKRAAVFDMVDRVVHAFGTVDILVNNAQTFAKLGSDKPNDSTQPLETFDEDDWEIVYRTGLMATLWGMKAVFPHMKQHGGKIINMGSAAGQLGLEGYGAYNATKEGIRALSRTAAREWGKYKINVNVINAGILTEKIKAQYGDRPDALQRMTERPVGRTGDPEKDAGGLAVFLASSDSDYLTGMTFMLDGGRFMWA
jgi:NAD(P)-dependent dehydrogenase (short-subunit alcohol dehydrogenase family)